MAPGICRIKSKPIRQHLTAAAAGRQAVQPWAGALPSLSPGAGSHSPTPRDPRHRQAQGRLLAGEALQCPLTLPHPPFPTPKLVAPLKTPHWNLCFVYPNSSGRQNPTHLCKPTKSQPSLNPSLTALPPPLLVQNKPLPYGIPSSQYPGHTGLHLLIPFCPSRLAVLNRESRGGGVGGLAALLSFTRRPPSSSCPWSVNTAPLPLGSPGPSKPLLHPPEAAAVRVGDTTPAPLSSNPSLWRKCPSPAPPP